MSSYNQVPAKTNVGTAIADAVQELRALRDEMDDLCAGIAGQFPETFLRIPKYHTAFAACRALDDADAAVGEISMSHTLQQLPITVTVGKQTRTNRAMSQRVRLGNAVVLLTEAKAELSKYDEEQDDVDLLAEAIQTVDGVNFPKTYG